VEHDAFSTKSAIDESFRVLTLQRDALGSAERDSHDGFVEPLRAPALLRRRRRVW
jgi:hypothetical protein